MSSIRQSFVTVVIFLLFISSFVWHYKTVWPAQSLPDMSVTHIVLFQFKPSADAAAIDDVSLYGFRLQYEYSLGVDIILSRSALACSD